MKLLILAKIVEFFEERLAAAERENGKALIQRFGLDGFLAQLRATAEEKDLQFESAKKENSAMRHDHGRKLFCKVGVF